MKIYTRGGDRGETDLYGGGRIAKDAARIEACGTIDELNCLLGVVRAESLHEELDAVLQRVQHELFDIGAEVASLDSARQKTAVASVRHVERLEADIDRFDEALEPLQDLILPGGSRSAALLHHARTVCRRAERRLVSLARIEGESLSPVLVPYLNRLSDLLFTLARVANRDAGRPDVAWKSRKGTV